MWSGQISALIGHEFSVLALPLVAILTLEASPSAVALMVAMANVPSVLFALFAGVVVDRFHRRSAEEQARIDDILATIRLEERYHVEHAEMWVSRLAGGPVEGRQRLAQGLESAIGEALAIFEAVPYEGSLVDDGVMPRSSEDLLTEWLDRVGTRLEEASLDWVLSAHTRAGGEMVPTSTGEIEAGPTLSVPGIEHREGSWVHVGEFAGQGGRQGRHTEDFQAVWEEMTGLYRAVPGVTW
jgi:hypothetical protein